MLGRVLLALLITGWLATPAVAKEYQADRFDVRIEVLPGGHLHVTETIVFRFVEGTFREVFRTVPTRRTDGIEFVPGRVEMPSGLCDRYAGRLQSTTICGAAAKRPTESNDFEQIPVEDRLPGMPGAGSP